MVGGGDEAVRREACGGVEQDGERGKPDGDNGRGVGGANTVKSQSDAEGYLRETGGGECVGRGGGEALRREEC